MEAKLANLTMAVRSRVNARPRCYRVWSLKAFTWAERAGWA